MSPEQDGDALKSNSLNLVHGLFEAIAPGSLVAPDRAFRKLVPTLRHLIVSKMEKPTTAQLEVLQEIDRHKFGNLLQVRKAIQLEDISFGPFPENLAETTLVPLLKSVGLTATLRSLTNEETKLQLEFLDNPPPYFKASSSEGK